MTWDWLVLAGAVAIAFFSGLALLLTGKRLARSEKITAAQQANINAVLAAAGERAREIIQQAEGLRAEIRQDVGRAADRLVEKLWQTYEAEIRAGLIRLQEQLKKEAQSEMKHLAESLRAAEVQAQKEAVARVARLIPEVVKTMAGRAVPVEVHEEAVEAAIRDAAAAGFFSEGSKKDE